MEFSITPRQMTRQELWRADYRADRYLRSATQEALERRSQDICDNMLNVNSSGQLTAGDLNEEGIFWWIRWTHILEELALRGLPYNSIELMTKTQFPWVSHPEPPRGLQILGKKSVGKEDLVRLGQKEHISDALKFGRFRIAPAAYYADPSLNPAIQDDELSVTAVHSGDTARITTIDKLTGQEIEIPVIGEIQYSRKSEENFYVLCMAGRYQPRLLDDFHANSVLIVHNVNRFLVRIEKAVKKIKPELKMAGEFVRYYDPYRVRLDELEPFYAKNFRYAYQREYRLVWYTPRLPLNAEPFFVEIGTMEHIATMRALRAAG